MFSKTIISITLTALFATSAIGAAVAPAPVERAIAIAKDNDAACNCPDNCQHNNGDSCSFYLNGNQIDGECQFDAANRLKCIG